ncbi:acetyl-coenzyme A transporter 1 [Parasteatoda tepidariorum]|uniref:acetyl-coenzyme A transporter 1 n=1 Tax=Parasteatoda tepidariorum TaxID=114398 RepID=UPI00077FC3A9|nr:acetyl-coenzyme A transporter 1 [Parasteatoda tepidariorum]XP_015905186.1 acetyl-coenzyme A transporter 1 [Parasteatoda tepidariorum]XP_015905187.1 acetyl-coenzyme A transporter 1 [Parasteatoda tepidariorum]XP_015905188.1 acetyl-coenzyme A transporter 1 [Parasteatoda tepidariorum]
MTTEEKAPQKDGYIGVSKDDKSTIIILLILYTLQGIPIGLAMSIALLLQKKNVTYKEQAMFSIVGWPYSLKLLWAPIVDSLYWKYMGRRKSWLISTQYVIGILMLILSFHVSDIFGDANDYPNVFYLTIAFFILNFLCATQDVAVDGWALTMLSRQNVGYATVCNSAGLRIGFFFGNIVYLILESPEFCNQYLRSVSRPEGLITLSGFLKVSGVIFLIVTTFILIYKSESEEINSEIPGVRETYSQIYHIVCLKSVIKLAIFLMTYQIAFVAVEAVSKLKFIEAGVHTETMALLEIPMTPFAVIVSLYISRFAVGLNCFKVFLKAFPIKLLFGVLFAFLVSWTYNVKLESGGFPTYYYVVIVLSFTLHQAVVVCLHISVGSFLNRVSDPAIGGTYMTILNTFLNLGRNWSSTVALWLVDVLTYKTCENPIYNCNNAETASKCMAAGHKCVTTVDGFSVESVACVIFGFLWLRWGRKVIVKLQGTLSSDWKTTKCIQLQNLESIVSKS